MTCTQHPPCSLPGPDSITTGAPCLHLPAPGPCACHPGTHTAHGAWKAGSVTQGCDKHTHAPTASIVSEASNSCQGLLRPAVSWKTSVGRPQHQGLRGSQEYGCGSRSEGPSAVSAGSLSFLTALWGLSRRCACFYGCSLGVSWNCRSLLFAELGSLLPKSAKLGMGRWWLGSWVPSFLSPDTLP